MFESGIWRREPDVLADDTPDRSLGRPMGRTSEVDQAMVRRDGR